MEKCLAGFFLFLFPLVLSRGEARSVMTQTHVNCTHSEPKDSTGAEQLWLSEKVLPSNVLQRSRCGRTQSGGESLRNIAKIYQMIHYEQYTELCGIGDSLADLRNV